MIKIVTDTSASLPPDLAADLDIRQVPAVLDFGGQLVREQTDLTSEQLFAYLAEVPPDVPYVTVPSPSDFMAIYDQLIADAPTATIFSIHVSAQLNDTLASARAAAAQYAGMDFRLFDSGSCLLGQGHMALEAARMAAAGAGADATQAYLNDLRARMRVACVVDTARIGGRTWAEFPGDARFALIALHEGTLAVQARYPDRAESIDALRELAALGSEADSLLGVMHAACEPDARALAARLEAALTPSTLIVAPVSPVFGVALGLGALGACWLAAG